MQIQIYRTKRSLKQSLHSALLTIDASKKTRRKQLNGPKIQFKLKDGRINNFLQDNINPKYDKPII